MSATVKKDAQILLDMMQSEFDETIEPMTGKELMEALGLQPGIGQVDFANACLRVDENPMVLNLPSVERLRVFRASMLMLGALVYG